MTRRISEISTNQYEPNKSTSSTKRANQQTKNIALNLSFLFFSFISNSLLVGQPFKFVDCEVGSVGLLLAEPLPPRARPYYTIKKNLVTLFLSRNIMHNYVHNTFDCVQAFLLKIECVLTDGRSIPNESGRSAFMLNEKDTFSLRMAKLNGYPVGLYSDELLKDEALFFKRYGIEESDIIIPCADRIEAINQFASQHNLEPKCVLYAGSDIPDTTCAKMAGVVASPSDAAPEMKEVSDYVSNYGGGHLFVRDILETVMKAQKRWCFDPVLYTKMF